MLSFDVAAGGDVKTIKSRDLVDAMARAAEHDRAGAAVSAIRRGRELVRTIEEIREHAGR